MRQTLVRAERELIDEIGSLRSQGESFARIAVTLNERGSRNSDGLLWSAEAVSMRFVRHEDPTPILHRIDNAASRLELGVFLLRKIALGTSDRAAEARLVLHVYDEAIAKGLPASEAADLAKVCLIEERAKRKQEAK